MQGNTLKELKGMEKDKGERKSKEDGPMEGIKDKREGEKIPLHRLHFEVRPNTAGIVTAFNIPAQQEGIEGYKEMLRRKIEKGKRKERKDETDLISASLDQRQRVSTECSLLWLVWEGVCVRSWFDLACYLVLVVLHINTSTCQTLKVSQAKGPGTIF